MSRKEENKGFTCEQCGREVMPVSNGSYRNHCPFCLHSKHVDITPGDRMSPCQGLMQSVGLIHKSGKGFQVVFVCLRCGEQRVNVIAEKTEQPDSIDSLVKLFQ
ncbi:RNHCP domain-containing protein [Candidatus Hydrogenedentota bacterium]